VARTVDQRRWAEALAAEVARVAAETPGRVLRTVFLGGGTPSLMDPETVDAVLRAARRAWPQANDVEVTMEANPTSAEAGRFRAYGQAGVTRLSLGVQALDDADLRALGRRHSAEEAVAAYRLARETFGRVSLDLIYARQGQSPEAWRAELARALDLVGGEGGGHLSLYQLTVEEGTAFGDRFRAGKLRGLPDEDRAADLWDLTQATCEAAGLPRLRGVQPRPAGRGRPPQPDLLARRRLGGGRARRARAPDLGRRSHGTEASARQGAGWRWWTARARARRAARRSRPRRPPKSG
jgi:oxygen-independent coproporphyrinogen-3 oxidase